MIEATERWLRIFTQGHIANSLDDDVHRKEILMRYGGHLGVAFRCRRFGEETKMLEKFQQ